MASGLQHLSVTSPMLRYSRRTQLPVLYLPCRHKRTQPLPHKRPLTVGTGGLMMLILSPVLLQWLDVPIRTLGMQQAYRCPLPSARAPLLGRGNLPRYRYLLSPRCDRLIFSCHFWLVQCGIGRLFLVFSFEQTISYNLGLEYPLERTFVPYILLLLLLLPRHSFIPHTRFRHCCSANYKKSCRWIPVFLP